MSHAAPTVSIARLPEGRGCVNDVATLALDIPLFPVERLMSLESLATARRDSLVRVGWAAVFLKAYAIVAREMPSLRSWLAGHLHHRIATCSQSVATLAVNRSDDGDRLFFARIARPDELPLPTLQASIDRFVREPVDKVFKRQSQFERVPGWLRRAILRWNMRSAGPKRATRIGTFSLSTLAGYSAMNRFHPTICTTSLSYGPLDDDGRCLVTVIADHRVLDGAAVAKALARLEAVLTGEITAELRTARPAPAEVAA